MKKKSHSRNQNRMNLIEDSEELIKKGKIEDAKKILKKGLKLNPENFVIFHKLCNILKEEGKISEYIELSNTIKNTDHKNFHLADGYFELQDFDNSLRLLNKITNTKKKSSHRNLKSKILLEMEKYDEALVEIDKAIEINPLNAGNILQKGEIFQRQKKYAIALEYFKQARTIDESPYIISAIISSLNGLNKHKEALKELDRLLVKNPNDVRLLNAKAGILRSLKKFDESINLMNKALKNEPHSIFLKRNLAKLLMEKKDYKNAIKILQELMGTAVEHSISVMLADAYWNSNKKNESISILQEEYKKSPNEMHIVIELVNRYLKINEYGKARDLIERHIKKISQNSSLHKQLGLIYNMLGLIYRNLKDNKKALSSFDKSLEINPDDATTLYNHACMNAINNNPEEAITMLKLAIMKKPQFKKLAREDEDLNSLRKLDEFKKILKNN